MRLRMSSGKSPEEIARRGGEGGERVASPARVFEEEVRSVISFVLFLCVVFTLLVENILLLLVCRFLEITILPSIERKLSSNHIQMWTCLKLTVYRSTRSFKLCQNKTFIYLFFYALIKYY